jgi:hypothetical protein
MLCVSSVAVASTAVLAAPPPPPQAAISTAVDISVKTNARLNIFLIDSQSD